MPAKKDVPSCSDQMLPTERKQLQTDHVAMNTADDNNIENEAKSISKADRYDAWKILLLIAFCLIRLEVGFICTMTGPILVDLQYQTDSSTTELSSIFFTRGVGFFLGSFLSVYFFKSNLTWIMTSFLVLVGGSCLLIPVSVNVYVLALAYLIQTTGFNIFRTSSPALLFSITRGDDRGPALQLVTMTFIIGATLSPPIAAPFVTSNTFHHGNLTLETAKSNVSTGGRSELVVWDSENKLLYLFLGMLVYTLFISLATALLGKCSRVDFSSMAKRTIIDNTRSKLATSIFVYTVCTVLMCIGGAAFTTGFNFITYHTVKTMHASETQGAISNTIFSTTVAITSVITIFTIKWWGYSKNVWAICFFMVSTPCVLLPTAFNVNYVVFCTALVSLGIATSFLFTPIFMWGAEKVDSLTMLSAWIQNGFTLAEISFPFIVGITLDLCEMVFVYWITGLCVAFVVVFVVGEVVYRLFLRKRSLETLRFARHEMSKIWFKTPVD